jgi:hypothetical protein
MTFSTIQNTLSPGCSTIYHSTVSAAFWCGRQISTIGCISWNTSVKAATLFHTCFESGIHAIQTAGCSAWTVAKYARGRFAATAKVAFYAALRFSLTAAKTISTKVSACASCVFSKTGFLKNGAATGCRSLTQFIASHPRVFIAGGGAGLSLIAAFAAYKTLSKQQFIPSPEG